MRFVALGLACLLASRTSDACAPPQLIDVALTADGATLLDDGGVVIETRTGGARGDKELGTGMTLASRGTQLAATADFIAPGLSVLRPSRGARRAITVVDGNGKVFLTLSQAKAKSPHAAPSAAGIRSTLPPAGTSNASLRAPGIEASTATLTLTVAADDDVVAVVVYLITKDGRQGVAYWHRTADLVYTYKTGGKGCVPGPRPLYQGEKVAIGFVDKHGRTSPLSNSLAVTP